MAQGRKYATLPDLDTAPDIYETAEPAGSERKGAQSPTSSASNSSDAEATASASSASENDNEEEDDGDETAPAKPSRVDRHANKPAKARDAFAGSRVDARGVDFSDRIAGGRRSYRVSSSGRSRRRRRRRQNGEGAGSVVEYGDFSDEEDEEESFAERLARLKREVEEMKAEGERLAAEGEDKKREEYQEAQDGIAELGKMLQALQAKRRAATAAGPHTAETATAGPSQEQTVENGATGEHAPKASATPAALPSSEELDRILSKAADFESRLALLETSLGAGSTSNADFNPRSSAANNNTNAVSKNVLTTLAGLEAQLSVLSSTTAPSLDSMSRQIRQLTDDAARLEDARTAARTAQENLVARSPLSAYRSSTGTDGYNNYAPTSTAVNGAADGSPSATSAGERGDAAQSVPEDAEQTARIGALYSTLPTIEAVAPLVPAVLERLKSLRVLHADAAVARENLAELEKAQARMEDEIKGWREGLERAERAFEESGKVGERNAGAVEEWVRDLEARLDAFA